MKTFKNIVLAIFIAQVVYVTEVLASNKADVSTVLDQLHLYASEANSNKYFSLFTDNAVFIGTDATEIWNMQEFKAFAQPYFSKGKGWTYISNNRHIYFSESKQTAWFDVMLFNDSYGETRGTGVLTKLGNDWKIEQYHLTFPIPNDVAKQVVKIIRNSKVDKN